MPKYFMTPAKVLLLHPFCPFDQSPPFDPSPPLQPLSTPSTLRHQSLPLPAPLCSSSPLTPLCPSSPSPLLSAPLRPLCPPLPPSAPLNVQAGAEYLRLTLGFV